MADNPFAQKLTAPKYNIFGKTGGVGVDPSSLQIPSMSPSNVETLPSRPIGSQDTPITVPNVGSSGQVNGGGGGLPPWLGDAASQGLSAFGKGMEGAANAKQSANQTETQGASALASAINNQSQLANQGSQNAMQYVSPDKSIAPFAQMAIQRALMNGLGPDSNHAVQFQAPSQLQGYMPSFGKGIDLGGVKDAANQYLGDGAIRAAMNQYQSQLTNVDPYANHLDMRSIYGDSGAADNADLTQMQKNAQERRTGYESTSQQALRDAIQHSKDNQKGGFWSSVGSGLLGMVPGILGKL